MDTSIKILNSEHYNFIDFNDEGSFGVFREEILNTLNEEFKDSKETKGATSVVYNLYVALNKQLFLNDCYSKAIDDEEFCMEITKRTPTEFYKKTENKGCKTATVDLFAYISYLFQTGQYTQMVESYNDKIYEIGGMLFYIDSIDAEGITEEDEDDVL